MWPLFPDLPSRARTCGLYFQRKLFRKVWRGNKGQLQFLYLDLLSRARTCGLHFQHKLFGKVWRGNKGGGQLQVLFLDLPSRARTCSLYVHHKLVRKVWRGNKVQLHDLFLDFPFEARTRGLYFCHHFCSEEFSPDKRSSFRLCSYAPGSGHVAVLVTNPLDKFATEISASFRICSWAFHLGPGHVAFISATNFLLKNWVEIRASFSSLGLRGQHRFCPDLLAANLELI